MGLKFKDVKNHDESTDISSTDLIKKDKLINDLNSDISYLKSELQVYKELLKEYPIVIFNNVKLKPIINISKFCIENGLDRSRFSKLLNGHINEYKGYSLFKYVNK